MAKVIGIDGKALILVISFIIIATVGASYITYLMFVNATENESRTIGGEAEEPPKLGPTYALEAFTVNLKANGGFRNDFVRASIVLELSDKGVINELRKRQPQVRDRIIEVLLNKTREELNSAKGLKSLREEIREAINPLLTSGEVKNVFFTEFVIQ